MYLHLKTTAFSYKICGLRLGARAETRFRLSAKRTTQFKSQVHGSVHQRWQQWIKTNQIPTSLIIIKTLLYSYSALHVSGTLAPIIRSLLILHIQPPVTAYATHSTLKPVPTLPRERQIALTVWQIPDAADTVVCAPDDGRKYHPKHVDQFPDINKLCNVASCWIYIGILLGAHPILHISRIRVKT
jgi:hypothetical protein